MLSRMTGTLLSGLLFAGCGGIQEPPTNTQPAVATRTAVVPTDDSPLVANLTSSGDTTHRVTRIIDKDPDGDGIVNRRIIITELFDKSGMKTSNPMASSMPAM